jgi:hypothetical protein
LLLMLSSNSMKLTSNNNLNALSSGILGVTGASLLLIPSHLKIVVSDQLSGVIVLLGISSYTIALWQQIVFVLQTPYKRIPFLRSISAISLFIFTWLYILAGCFAEASIFFLVGIMQFILASPLNRRFEHINLFSLTFVLIGFSSGIFLAISNGQYAQLDIT